MVFPSNEVVIGLSLQHGFQLCGFAPYALLQDETSHLNQWLQNGYQAGMQYMERNTTKRFDVREILPDAQSVISLGMYYNTPFVHEEKENTGKISRYAWGMDYHEIMWEKLDTMLAALQADYPDLRVISYVDTGPVMDKAWAVRAGLGWMGKHSNIINPENGSWFFIASIITNAPFSYSSIVHDFCGTCTKCIDACPTNAIVQNYVVDAQRCISYLTIENKGAIDDSFIPLMDDWIFGCDVCQDVCPWNKKFSAVTDDDRFYPVDGRTSINLDAVKNMENSAFKEAFAESPVKRTKLKGLQRNAETLQKNRKRIKE